MVEVSDYSLDFSGGQDADTLPSRIELNQYQSGINVSCNKGILSPRYGFQHINLTYKFDTEYKFTSGLTKDYQDIFKYGKFQAQIPYSTGTDYYQLIIISGIIFLIDQQTFEVSVVEIMGGSRLNDIRPRTNWSYAGRYLLIFDYPAYPVIIEGTTARRADPAQLEIPVSVLGTYNQNRVFFSNVTDEFSAGDPAAYGFPRGPITAEELLTPAGSFFGQIFQLSTNYSNDEITAMGFLQRVDGSTEIGPLLVCTRNSIFTYQTQKPRTEWDSNGFGSIFVTNAGVAGARSFTNVNSDFLFMSPDSQIRSASMSRSEQGSWSKTPISKEITNFLKTFDRGLVQYSTMTYFKDKVFALVNPYRELAANPDGTPILEEIFGGIAVLELDNVSTMSKKSPPAWAGLWTGVRPMDIAVNNGRCFIMAKEGGVNTLYEMRSDITHDLIGEAQEIRQVRSKVYTREYAFDSPFNTKTLTSVDVALHEVLGDFKLNVKYKPSHSSKFLQWKEFTHNAPWRTCSIPEGCQWKGLDGHSFRELNLGSPEEEGCDPVTDDKLDSFRRVQLLLELEGIYWEIHELTVRADGGPQNTTEAVCDEYDKVVEICADCNTDWEIPDICQEKLET